MYDSFTTSAARYGWGCTLTSHPVRLYSQTTSIRSLLLFTMACHAFFHQYNILQYIPFL